MAADGTAYEDTFPRHAAKPKTRRAFWKAKLVRNVARDREVTRALLKAGWRVVRVWECALTRARNRFNRDPICVAVMAQGKRCLAKR